jgi:hypothetical protein
MAFGLTQSRRAGPGNGMTRFARCGFASKGPLGAATLVALVLCMPSRLVHGVEADRPPLANRLDEIGPLLSRCLPMPDYDVARPGMQITVRLAFTRDGAILGEPRFTFTTPGVSPEVRAAYQRAVVDMLNRCTPLPITKELGNAIAGRPFVIPIVETCKEEKAETPHDSKS